MSESSHLLDENSIHSRVIVKLRANGQRFINGVSSSYEDFYQEQLCDIITQSELTDIVSRLNETLQSFWPCTACYVFGFVCSPFTLGTSLLCPHYCISQSDEHSQIMLEQVSLKAKYYDRKIKFRIVKECCSSYVEISFPLQLIKIDGQRSTDLEQGEIVRDVANGASDTGRLLYPVVLPAVFSLQPGIGVNRLKDS